MIDLSGIQQIQARIAEIEGEFNLKQQNLPGLDFASKLQQEIDKNTAAAASKAHAAQRVDGTKPVASPTHAEKAGKAELANPDLTQMIHQAAQKYHVDPNSFRPSPRSSRADIRMPSLLRARSASCSSCRRLPPGLGLTRTVRRAMLRAARSI